MSIGKPFAAEELGVSRALRRLPSRLRRSWRLHGASVFLIPFGLCCEAATIAVMPGLSPPRFFTLSVMNAMCLSLGLYAKRRKRNPLWDIRF
jgi:hypothetical protein